MTKQNLSEILTKVVNEYNEYRSPEATAQVLRMDESSFEVEFTRPFCRSCGFYDYFDDLRILLEDERVITATTEVKENGDSTTVKFKIT
ncbi:MAG: hypothetical protein ACE5LA_04760 [Dehalococcoidales bacterium]